MGGGDQDHTNNMAFRHAHKTIREAYEERFSANDARQVTVHRVVNIVDKRSPSPRVGLDYDRGFHNDQWYGGPRNYHDAREFYVDGNYPPDNCRYFDENPDLGNFHRSSSPSQNDSLSYGREDLRHHLNQRKNVRPGPYFRNRGREFGPHRREDRDDYKISTPIVIKRDRSPGRREVQPTGHSGSNSSSRSFSPDRDKGYSYQQSLQRHSTLERDEECVDSKKSNVLTSHGSSSSAEGSAEPHSSGSSEDKTSASVAELEEVAATSMEPKPVPEVDFNARRLEAIKAKALDIEKHYRQDCETFRTVVKMLVAKEPSLENLLQAPLDENLSELKHHCLDALRHFVKELDEVLEQPDTSVKGTHHKTLE